MRRITKRGLAYETHGIQLNDKEMTTLRSASRIAEKARELAREMSPDFEDWSLDLVLAGIEHNYKEFEDGFIPVTDTYAPAV